MNECQYPDFIPYVIEHNLSSNYKLQFLMKIRYRTNTDMGPYDTIGRNGGGWTAYPSFPNAIKIKMRINANVLEI